jgi:hypothetical protein
MEYYEIQERMITQVLSLIGRVGTREAPLVFVSIIYCQRSASELLFGLVLIESIIRNSAW